MSIAAAAFLPNIMDVAPRHAGVLTGLSNTIATAPGVLCNLSTGALLQGLGPAAGWLCVFLIAASVQACALLVFVCCASGRELVLSTAPAPAAQSAFELSRPAVELDLGAGEIQNDQLRFLASGTPLEAPSMHARRMWHVSTCECFTASSH